MTVTAETLMKLLISDTDYRHAPCRALQKGVACHAFATLKGNKFNLAHHSFFFFFLKTIKLCIFYLSDGLTGKKKKKALSDLCNLFI